jgi:hypothetical protein
MTPCTRTRGSRGGLSFLGRLAGIVVLASTGCYADAVLPGEYGPPDDAGVEASVPVDPPAMTSDPGSTTAPSADGGVPVAAGDAGASSVTKTVACDLSGRWIATDREVSTALGAVEAAHTWYYLELTQSGGSGTIIKGLNCGQNVRGISSVAASVDYPKTWPALLTKTSQAGRKYTSATSGSGCHVAFEKRYTVYGCSSGYVDPSTTLPMPSQQASGSTSGWEDWDNDGNPGYTMSVTGLATGQLYMASRTWNAWSGSVTKGASTFQLPDDWTSEADLLGYMGSSLLTETASGVRDSDDSLHFVEFARLSASQATGDDTAVCASIRMLAATLTPHADN